MDKQYLMQLAEEQAKVLMEAEVSCIVADGENMTYQDFKDWIHGTIENFSNDEDWIEFVEEFGIKMNIIQENSRIVYGFIFVNM